MATADAEKLLDEQIEQNIANLDQKRSYYRSRAFAYAIATSALSASTTLFIALGKIYASDILSVLALLASTTITVVATWDAFFNYRQRWIQSNETLMDLYALRSDLAFERSLSNGQLEEQKLRTFQMRYSTLLAAANRGWTQARQGTAQPKRK
jgi:hypothetical protein